MWTLIRDILLRLTSFVGVKLYNRTEVFEVRLYNEADVARRGGRVRFKAAVC